MAAPAQTKVALQLEAVGGFVEKLSELIDIDEDIEAVVNKYMDALRAKADADTVLVPQGTNAVEKKVRKSRKNPDGTIKPKRKPSAYNMFVSEHWAELTEKGFKGQELIRQAAILWNNRSEKEPKQSEDDDENAPMPAVDLSAMEPYLPSEADNSDSESDSDDDDNLPATKKDMDLTAGLAKMDKKKGRK